MAPSRQDSTETTLEWADKVIVPPLPNGTSERTRVTPWLRYVKFAATIAVLLVLVWVYLVRTTFIHPEKPQFTLQDITLYSFNVSTEPSLVSSRFEVTILSHNPNARFGMYYDTLIGYGMYHDQQVTSGTEVPDGTYQGHKSSVVWSLLISGTSVPIDPSIGGALSRDWSNQIVAIVIKLEGQLRWKLGSLAKGESHITVRCPAYLMFWSHPTGFSAGINAIKYRLLQRCNVDFSR